MVGTLPRPLTNTASVQPRCPRGALKRPQRETSHHLSVTNLSTTNNQLAGPSSFDTLAIVRFCNWNMNWNMNWNICFSSSEESPGRSRIAVGTAFPGDKSGLSERFQSSLGCGTSNA